MSGTDLFISALSRSTECKPRKGSRGLRGWSCKCVCHEDGKRGNLDIDEGNDGMPLVLCRSCGARYEDVLARIGLTAREVREANGDVHHGWSPGGGRPALRNGSPSAPPASVTGNEQDAALKKGFRRYPEKPKRVPGTMKAKAPDGRRCHAVYEVPGRDDIVKWRRNTKDRKVIAWMHRTAEGTWVPGTPEDFEPRDAPLYGLGILDGLLCRAEYADASAGPITVLLVEGENVADAFNHVFNLQAAWYVALSAMTSSVATDVVDDLLSRLDASAGDRVILMPDFDAPGYRTMAKHAMTMASARRPDDAPVSFIDMLALAEDENLPAGVEVFQGFDGADLVPAFETADAVLAAVDGLLGHLVEVTGVESILGRWVEGDDDQTTPRAVVEVFQPEEVDTEARYAMPEFPLHALPETSQALLRSVMAAMESCTAGMLAPAHLTTLAASVGVGVAFSPKRGYVVRPILWSGVVCESGATKSPAQDPILEPLRERDKAKQKRFREARRQHKAWQSVKKTERGDEPPAPVQDRVTVNDFTTEALGRLLAVNPRGLTADMDELSRFFLSMDLYKKNTGVDEKRYIAMFEGKALTIDRAGNEDPIHVPRAALNIIGTIQPDTLKKVLIPTYFDSGFAQRFLWAMPPPIPPGWTEEEVSEACLEDVDKVVAAMRRFHPVSPDETLALGLAPDAKRLWIEWESRMKHRWQAATEGSVKGLLSKGKGLAGKLALIHHAATLAERGATTLVGTAISKSSVEAGIVIARWWLTETQRVWAEMGKAASVAAPAWLEALEAFMAKHGWVTARLVQNKGPYALREPGQARKALKWMVAHDRAVERTGVSGPKGGRAATEYRLMPDGGREVVSHGVSQPSSPQPAGNGVSSHVAGVAGGAGEVGASPSPDQTPATVATATQPRSSGLAPVDAATRSATEPPLTPCPDCRRANPWSGFHVDGCKSCGQRCACSTCRLEDRP